jgi:hypothetical protein
VEFEPTIPAFMWGKRVHASDRAATVIGKDCSIAIFQPDPSTAKTFSKASSQKPHSDSESSRSVCCFELWTLTPLSEPSIMPHACDEFVKSLLPNNYVGIKLGQLVGTVTRRNAFTYVCCPIMHLMPFSLHSRVHVLTCQLCVPNCAI